MERLGHGAVYVEGDELCCRELDSVRERWVFPAFDRSNVVGMQSDRARPGCDAAVAVDQVLRHAPAQGVPDPHTGDGASPPFAPVHRVDRRRTRETRDGRHDAHAGRIRLRFLPRRLRSEALKRRPAHLEPVPRPLRCAADRFLRECAAFEVLRRVLLMNIERLDRLASARYPDGVASLVKDRPTARLDPRLAQARTAADLRSLRFAAERFARLASRKGRTRCVAREVADDSMIRTAEQLPRRSVSRKRKHRDGDHRQSKDSTEQRSDCHDRG
jgi:hypothetical protein